MHTAACQIRARPDSAWSTPRSPPSQAIAVRAKRSRSCGTLAVNAPAASTASSASNASRFQPNWRTPL
ncbi:hypothetical protein G6F31_021314 [Rhizopus arrhizus]|nr:hypothetical protein G6F31_021314 [Rhizopus arrhizus]